MTSGNEAKILSKEAWKLHTVLEAYQGIHNSDKALTNSSKRFPNVINGKPPGVIPDEGAWGEKRASVPAVAGGRGEGLRATDT